MVGFGKLSRILSGSSDADAMMWAWRGGGEFFGVYVGWDFTAMVGGIASNDFAIDYIKTIDSRYCSSTANGGETPTKINSVTN